MKIGLFGNHYLGKSCETERHLITLCHALKKYDISVYLPDCLFQTLSRKAQDEIHPMCILFDVLPPLDMVLSVGGDGTFLRTASFVGRSDIPILGINTGRLGFLADINFGELDATLSEIVNRQYRVEERTLLSVYPDDEMMNVLGNTGALNEVSVLKQDTASMLSIEAYIDNEYLTLYQADGLVLATPTGSTAYSLSIGGPILTPSSPSIILAAIAPHSLTARPLVVNDSSLISLKVKSRSGNFLVSIDGESQVFPEHVALHVRKSDYTLKVVKRAHHTFYKTLRDKLMWGADVRG